MFFVAFTPLSLLLVELFNRNSIVRLLFLLAAEDEAKNVKDENAVCMDLTKAMKVAKNAACIKAHPSKEPLFLGMEVMAAPANNKQIIRRVQEAIGKDCFIPYKDSAWFVFIKNEPNKA